MITNAAIWLTPVWILSLGMTAGAAILLILFGILWLISRSTAAATARLVKESILQWISYMVIAFVVFAVVGTAFMPWQQVVHSLQRLPEVGTQTLTVEVPPRTDDFEVDVRFLADELQRYAISSEQDVIVGVEKGRAYADPLILVEGSDPPTPYTWTPSSKRKRMFEGEVAKIFVTNQSDAATPVTVEIVTDVPHPQVRYILMTAASVVGVYLVYFLIHALLPQISTIALATSKEAVAQPLYLLVTIIGGVLLMLFVIIPYNTFGEDVKMFKDSGLMTIIMLAILVAVWTASVSVADEIEGRTALTLLSKPISRRQFVLGKFLGIVWPILLMFIVLGIWMMIWVSCKVVYDARETSNPEPSWTVCSTEMFGLVPGLVLGFMQAVVMAAISVAISTRLPMLPNILTCVAIFALGNLGPVIVQSGVGKNEFVAFFGQLVALILPMLDVFNIQAAVAAGKPVPFDYIAWAALYCIIYSAVAMLFALILFEDRDLA
jgi:ABC-type transport system involved in multi-copper enzyme maturation permease subunit